MTKTIPLVMAASAVYAQQPPQPRIISPEVGPDRTVTFRLKAPNAKEVTVTGNFTRKPQPLTRDESGIWSLTTAALEPDTYDYTLRIDGVSHIDPANPLVKTGVRGTQSLVRVPGASPNIWDDQPVAHGTLHQHVYRSKAIGDTRSFIVYTPPGYDASSRTTYPVMYLLHGSGDRPNAWVEAGQANFIFDNLLARKQMKPMIVVMPFGHAVDPFNTAPEMRGKNTALFAKDLLNDVIPQAEAAYRIASGTVNTAIAGLSMGGGQALFVGLNNPSKFAYVAGFSASVPRSNPEEQYVSVVANAPATNKAFKLIWMATGKDDSLLQADQQFVQWLKEHGVSLAWKETEGAHTWLVWRRYLAEFAPLLFR